jgi:hypothetical protein
MTGKTMRAAGLRGTQSDALPDENMGASHLIQKVEKL